MSALFEKVQFRTGLMGKRRHRLPGNVGIIFGVKEHQLAGVDFVSMKSGVVELAGVKLGPILRVQAVAIPKSFPNIGCITFVGGFPFLGIPQDRPIYHRAIGNGFFDPWVQNA